MTDLEIKKILVTLSQGEAEVVYYSCRGLTRGQILERSDWSKGTIDGNFNRVYKKFGTKGRKGKVTTLTDLIEEVVFQYINSDSSLDAWESIKVIIRRDIRREEAEIVDGAPEEKPDAPVDGKPFEYIPRPPGPIIIQPEPEPEPEPEPPEPEPPEPEPPDGPITIDPVPPRPRPRPEPTPRPRYMEACLVIAGTLFLCFAFYQIYKAVNLENNKSRSSQATPSVSSIILTPKSSKNRIVYDFRNGVDPAWRLEGDEADITESGIVSRGTTLLHLGDGSWKNYSIIFTLSDVEGSYDGSITVRNSTTCKIRFEYFGDFYVVTGNTSIVIPPEDLINDVIEGGLNGATVDGNKINFNRSKHILPDQYATLCGYGGIVFELKGDAALQVVVITPISD